MTWQQFDIKLSSFSDVQDFVQIASLQPFQVLVGNGRILVNAKSFMGLFSLDHQWPVHVRVDCSDEQCRLFQESLARFLI